MRAVCRSLSLLPKCWCKNIIRERTMTRCLVQQSTVFMIPSSSQSPRGLHTSRVTWSEDHTQARAFLKAVTQPGVGMKEVTEIYDKVNTQYDQNLIDLEYNGARKASQVAKDVLGDQTDLKILDVGAGTGLSGEALNKIGFSSIDAVDCSKGMLDLARGKNVYGQLVCQFVGENPMPFEDGTYDAAVMVGAMTDNHIPQEGLRDVIRVVKKGGYVINVFREPALHTDYYKGGLGQYMSQLEAQGLWTLEKKEVFSRFVADIDGVYFVHRIN